ncbi:hypothetical protein TPHA_0K01890 [Tetrapisispora phaffii CBS 4417]|uniref:Exoribonuclease phosphorolytic domain-containing protein n=1 Tax=Tetrapisispora phaffii (strain ATCC 24235 / CBS 4417 / NBRC 1672 / NRRL Y-8282 / UCD 70-5) TaxID=1071381 RepID=G8BZJ3_TETPH|nr:hypothetical protein TPHA_0K01890 [Tetrapisispora phaffii CBS 4417]CCE65321.1 hypothetical protein TPHA_0K01890 [Tetrapisispora phaffii CBS 4417]
MNVQDRRRLLGPSNAKPIVFSAATDIQSSEPKKDESSSFILNSGLIENCNGSSLVEIRDPKVTQHQTSLITSVYGPRATKGSFTSQASLSIQLKNGSSEKYNTTELKEVSSFLVNVFNSVINLSRYPKSGIDIFIYILYDKVLSEESKKSNNISAILPYCISAITLALINAGIEVDDIATAGYYKGDVISFIKNGEEVIGYWKDEGNCESFDVALEHCKTEAQKFKNLITTHILEE